jgi:RNA polymerase sigma-70 factor, ECF subfamily
MDESANTFTAMRPQLERIAFRILQSREEARAVVDSVSLQFRWQASILGTPTDSRAWLMSATSRLALERWTAGDARRHGAEASPPNAPLRTAPLMEDILTATLVALEQLDPDARLAFLLHDIFDADLDEVVMTLGRPEADCRGLVDRARELLHRHPHRKTP